MNIIKCSAMNLRSAAKVSRRTVNKVLSNCGPPDATRTAKFC